MRRVFLLAVLTGAGLLSLRAQAARPILAPLPDAQTVQAPFRAGVDLVQVDVSVLDRQRTPVRGLTAADFTLLEDGKPRRIAAFTAVELPPRTGAPAAAWTNEIASDVSTNTLPEDGRLVVILMDRSIPDGFPSLNAQSIARAAVEELGPGDLAAVVYTGGGLPQNFTNDRERLLAAIERSYAPDDASAAADEAWTTSVDDMMTLFDRSPPSAVGALNFSAGCHCGACVLQAVGRIADAVREVPRRRKVLLFIGTNLQVETTDSICIDPVRKAREAMFRSLDLASLTVHALDPGGLETPVSQPAFRGLFRYRGRQNLVRQGNISVLPDRTGGRTVLNTNDPLLRVPDILAESDSYYLLGFEPAAADGRRHEIKVKVNRRGVDVRTRRQYLAEEPAPAVRPPDPDETAWDAVSGLLPIGGGVSISALASAFAEPITNEPVLAITLHVRHAADAPAPATSGAEEVEVVTEILGATGRPVGALRQTLAVTPTADHAGDVAYDVLQRIPAKPGRYEIRIGLHNEARRQTGSVYTFVDVPDYRRTAFAVGDVELYVPPMAPAMADDLADLLLAPPTARRAFDRTEQATAFVRLYQASSAPPAGVALSTRIVDARGRKRYGQEASIGADAFRATGAVDYVVDLPLADLEGGAYLLTIEARAGASAAKRDVRFTVR